MSEEVSEIVSKSEKILSFFISVISIIISFYLGIFSYYLLILLFLSVSVFIFRYNLLIKLILSKNDKISIIPRPSLEKRRALQNLIIISSLIFSPFLLIYIFPPILWITFTLAIVTSWPFSAIIALLVIYILEKRRGVKIYRYAIFDERLDEINIKEYGIIAYRQDSLRKQ